MVLTLTRCVAFYSSYPYQLIITLQDRIRAFSSQPLHDLPPYLKPGSAQKLKPPVLHFGWIMDLPKIFQYIEDSCPSIAKYMGKLRSPDYKGTFAPMSGNNPFVAHLISTLGIETPSEQRRISIVYFCDGKGSPDVASEFVLGLSIGTNYDGVISNTCQTQLETIFAFGIQARWFLDRHEFRWKKSPKLASLPGPSCYFSPQNASENLQYLFLPQADCYSEEVRQSAMVFCNYSSISSRTD
jgi:hypothetical protein